MTQVEHYIPRFERYCRAAQELFFDCKPLGDVKGTETAVSICSAALEMLRVACEVRAWVRAFSVLDSNGREAVAQIVGQRLSEVAEIAKMQRLDEISSPSALETEIQQFRADISRFIATIPRAHSAALDVSSAGQLES
jgi:hypothetical protein